MQVIKHQVVITSGSFPLESVGRLEMRANYPGDYNSCTELA